MTRVGCSCWLFVCLCSQLRSSYGLISFEADVLTLLVVCPGKWVSCDREECVVDFTPTQWDHLLRIGATNKMWTQYLQALLSWLSHSGSEGARCSSVVECLLMMWWVVESIPCDGPIELFLIPGCAILSFGWCI